MRAARLTLGLWLLASAVGGCSVRAQHLRSHPLNTQSTVDSVRQSSARFLIYPFEDLRGGEYGYIYATSFIPVVDFFHIGSTNEYPEQSGSLESSQGGRPMVTVGSLDTAMPYLLSSLMRQMRLTQSVTPIDEANTQVDLSGFDYVVMGKLRRTHFETHINIVPLGLLSLLGVPYCFVSMDMSYEVDVFRPGSMSVPLAHHTYQFRGSRSVGLYYNLSAYYDLFIEGLEETMPRVVTDLAESVTPGHSERQSAPAARTAQAPGATQPSAIAPAVPAAPPRRPRRTR